MNKLPLIVVLLLFVGISGCSSGEPSEQELKDRFVGIYCNGLSKLELTADGVYSSRRVLKGIATGQPIAERCTGKYSFVFDSNTHQWKIVFNKSDDNSSKMVSCKGEQVIWEKDKGYVAGDSIPELQTLIDLVKVKLNNNCD